MPIDDSRPSWVQLVDDFRMRIVTADDAALAAVRRDLAVGAADAYIAAVAAIGMDLAQAGEILAERWPAHPAQKPGETS